MNSMQTLKSMIPSKVKKHPKVQRVRNALSALKRMDVIWLNAISDLRFSPEANFLHLETLGLTKRRQEHLASLGLPLSDRSVLEVGAGIGDHTGFFLDRGCKVLSTEVRAENLAVFRDRYANYDWYSKAANLRIEQLDIDEPPASVPGRFDVVYCYGVLYHLKNPARAIRFMSECCEDLLLLETSVSFGDQEEVMSGAEDARIVSQAIHGVGSHPTRPWIYSELKKHFAHVYMPLTQPWHEQFPTDWTRHVPTPGVAQRAVFVASRRKLANPLLMEGIPSAQQR